MKKSSFEKKVSKKARSGRVIEATVTATMNASTEVITGTHSATHDEYSRTINTHQIVACVDGVVWKKLNGIRSEKEVLASSELLIEEVKEYVNELAIEDKQDSFGDKMKKLYS